MQGNVLGQIGGSIGLNIFTQPNEPNKKDGIWIKTDKKYDYDDVQIVNDYAKTLNRYVKLRDIPISFTGRAAVAVGNEIYLFHNAYYKYNMLTNTYTKLENAIEGQPPNAAVAIDSNIFLLGGTFRETDNYKYDTLTNTYIKLSDIPFKFEDGSAVAIGNEIYLFNREYYKYNTLTDLYTELEEAPYILDNGSAVAIDNNIFLLGGVGGRTYNYLYNTLTNLYTKLEDIPYNFDNGSAVAIDNNIFLLGSFNSSAYTYNYLYNTLTNSYTKLEDIPYNFYDGSAVAIDNNIYLLGGDDDAKNYNYKYKAYLENKTIFIKTQTDKLNVFLNDILKVYFSDIIVYDNYAPQNFLIYYGNGTEWIEIV